MFRKNKKAISDLISFVLLTFLVLTSSLIAYSFSKNFFDEKINERDSKYIENFFKKIYSQLDNLAKRDGSFLVVPLNFDSGLIKFNGSKITYYSLVKSDTSEICIDNLCYGSNLGYEVLSVNFNEFVFEDNFSLVPENYNLGFSFNKSSSIMSVFLK